MTDAMKRVIQNVPVVETRGNYIINVRYSFAGHPVLTVRCAEDDPENDLKAVHMDIYLGRGVITLVPSLSLPFKHPIWETVIKLFDGLADYSPRDNLLRFNSEEHLMASLDCFLTKLENL